jgi:hypothetical protein
MAIHVLWNVTLLRFVEVSKDRRLSLPGSGSPGLPDPEDEDTLILLETSGTTHRPTQLHITILDTNQRQQQVRAQRSLESSCSRHEMLQELNSVQIAGLALTVFLN